MKVTVLAENYVSFSIGLMGEHGFSAYIEREGKGYLFDTGQHGVCVDNANTLGIDLKHIDRILLSHGHYDHVGGLVRVLKTLGKETEIVGHPAMFDKKYAVTQVFGKRFIGVAWEKTYLEDALKARFNLTEGTYEVGPGLWLTGQVPSTNEYEQISDYLQVERNGKLEKDTLLDDNSLVMDTKEGLLMIVGCAHRGIVNIMSYARKTFNRPIYGVLGGTHLMGVSEEHLNFVKDFIATENIRFFAPSHCTGIHHIITFSKSHKAITQPAFCGTNFDFL